MVFAAGVLSGVSSLQHVAACVGASGTCTHSEHRIPASASVQTLPELVTPLKPRWGAGGGWVGRVWGVGSTLYLLAAVHRRRQRLPKNLRINKTVEAT